MVRNWRWHSHKALCKNSSIVMPFYSNTNYYNNFQICKKLDDLYINLDGIQIELQKRLALPILQTKLNKMRASRWPFQINFLNKFARPQTFYTTFSSKLFCILIGGQLFLFEWLFIILLSFFWKKKCKLSSWK